MYTEDQVYQAITNSAFIKIEGIMYRVDGHIIEEKEKEFYILHEDSGEVYSYTLTDKKDMTTLQNAEFFELKKLDM